MKRPIGVTLLAIIFAAAGLSYMLLGFQLTTAVTFGPIPAGQGTWIWGWLIILTGLAFWAGGVAAWSLQPWGWMLGQILAIVGILEAIFALLDREPGLCPRVDSFPVHPAVVPEPGLDQAAFGLTEDV